MIVLDTTPQGSMTPPGIYKQTDLTQLRLMVTAGATSKALVADMAARGYGARDVLAGIETLFTMAALPKIMDPIEAALFVLAGAAWADHRAPWGYVYRGKQVEPRRLVRIANTSLKHLGYPPIRYPGIPRGADASAPDRDRKVTA